MNQGFRAFLQWEKKREISPIWKGAEIMKKQLKKIPQTVIEEAKQVDIYKVLEEFDWPLDATGLKTLCPNVKHQDRHAGVPINTKNNTCRCFLCGETFDTIKLLQKLSLKCRGTEINFPKAVKCLFAIDNSISIPAYTGIMSCNKQQTSTGTDIYDRVLANSTEMRGYEIDYLKNRGIFLYPVYVYQNKAYTEFEMKHAMKQTADQSVIDFYKEVKKQGTYYNGIANILKANHVEIRHNYYKDTNYILYVIDYDYDTDETLQFYAEYLKNTSRHMLIQKSIENIVPPIKKMQGEGDFCILAEGIQSNDIYICEGMEDALSFVQNGYKAVSLNSTGNANSLMDYLKTEYEYKKEDRFLLALDHDEAGEKTTKKLVDFFEEHNTKKRYHHFQYGLCKYPASFKDINDYWKSKVFQ